MTMPEKENAVDPAITQNLPVEDGDAQKQRDSFDRDLLRARATADTGRYPAAQEMAENLRSDLDPIRSFDRSSLIVRLFAERGLFEDAYIAGLEMLENAEAAFGKPSPERLRALNLLGWAASRSLRHVEALQLAELAYAEASQVLSTTHPELLEAQNNLARFAHRAGQSARATAIGRKVVDRRKQVLGDQHQKTLTSIDNLAVYLEHRGEPGEALQLVETAIAGWTETLGTTHPKSLPPQVHRVRLMTNAGRSTEVVEDALALIATHEKSLGSAHGNSINAAEVAAACIKGAERPEYLEVLREFLHRAESSGASAAALSRLTELLDS